MGEVLDSLEVRTSKDVGPGWVELVEDTVRALNEIAPGWACLQVKEKFGGLRFYYSPPEDASDALKYACMAIVAYAESRAYHTCEQCGEAGKLRTTKVDDEGNPQPFAWHLTLCDRHSVEKGYQ